MENLNKQQLLKELQKTLTKIKTDKLYHILNHTVFNMRDVIDLTFHEDKKTAFRAAWLLENYLLSRSAVNLQELEYLINAFTNVQYPSCQRHYAKIAMLITSDETYKPITEMVAGTSIEAVIDKCFSWMIDPKVLVAVKVFAADALYNLSPRYPWIREELKEQLIFLMRDGSAAMQHRAKKLIPKL